MAMGLDRNTQDYIWKMESGSASIEIEARERAIKYLLEILDMGEHRWPKICMMEELRGLRNGNPSKWGKNLKETLRNVGDEKTIDWLCRGIRREAMEKNLKRGIITRRNQETQGNWSRIEKSKYCKNYGTWKKTVGREKYWEDKELEYMDKEKWARLRCENVGKAGNTGFVDTRCRLCREEDEELEHM